MLSTWGTRLAEWVPAGDLRRLVVVRGLRSLTQGYVMVVFTIYLSQIGFSAWLIGLTLTIVGATSSVLTLIIGVSSDRFGRRSFLLVYSFLLLASGIIFSLTTLPWILIGISALGGLGRGGGGGGQAGAFSPAEQAMIAEKASGDGRRKVFAANSVVGTSMAAVGALLAGIPELLRSTDHLSLVASYRPLFFGVALVGLVSIVLLWPITDVKRAPAPAQRNAAARARRSQTRQRISQIAIAGSINGFGMGFIASLVPYWMHIRYGVSPGAIGPVMSISSALTAIASLYAVRLAARFGDIMVITGSRLAGVVLTLALPFSPLYPLAAILYGVRMISSQMAMPVRQSYTMGIIDAGSRGSAAGISGVARRLPASASPTISGYWFGAGELELPFIASAACLLLNAGLYFWWFRDIHPDEELATVPPEVPAEHTALEAARGAASKTSSD
ncbi:MAG TPA: MFS transporter [Nitrolancea sp.]|nr:MFS transporter [Nitrolancea sp.]